MKNRSFNYFRFGILALLAFNLVFLMSSCGKDEAAGLPDGVTRFYVKSFPKVAYALDAPIDLTGLVMTVERGAESTDVPFADFEKEKIVVEPVNGTVVTFNHYSLNITHTKSGKGVVLPIDVTNVVVSLSVNTPPVSTYNVADALNLSALAINLIRENGASEVLKFADFADVAVCEPANGTILTELNTKVVVTYLPTKVKLEIPIVVNPFRPVSASVKTMPTKSAYGIGERLDLKGLVMAYVMGDGSTTDVPYEMFGTYGIETSLLNNDVVGASDTPIKVLHTLSGFSANLPITVNSALVVKSMYVSILPKKLFYKDGEVIDLTGIEVSITRSDNVVLLIPFASFSKVGLTTSPAHGVVFNTSMPYVTISIAGSTITTRSPLKMAIPASALNVKLAAVSPTKWSIQNHFEKDVVIYSDRTYKIGTFPNELRGLQWIQTTMDLRYMTDEQVAGLNLPGAYTVYFVHYKATKAPAWLARDGWALTTMAIKLDNNFNYVVYKKEYASGEEVKLYRFADTNSVNPPYFLILERR